jgi:hypothetical protein
MAIAIFAEKQMWRIRNSRNIQEFRHSLVRHSVRAHRRPMIASRAWAMILPLAVLAASCTSRAPEGGSGAEDENARLQKRLAELTWQEKTITAEYSLARAPAPYLVVDLTARSIDLKAQARTFRSFKITDVRRSGPQGQAIDTWALVSKKPYQTNERPKITPGAGDDAAAAAAKQALWGPHRMPSDYDLIFDGGKALEIRALPSEQSGWLVGRAITSAYRRTVDWYRHWSVSKDSLPQYTVQLWLSENDSQALFWSLPKQLSALVLDGGNFR